MTDLHTENARLRAALIEVVAAYDLSNPVRTADMHLLTCNCLRCTVDAARAALATPAPDTLRQVREALDAARNLVCHEGWGTVNYTDGKMWRDADKLRAALALLTKE